MLHSAQTINHPIENWTYATQALRLAASGFVAGDVGRIAFVSGDITYWRLIAVTPTWEQMSIITNASSASQAPAASTRTYITGSAISLAKLKVGTILRWKFNITKTAAGTALSTFDVAFGTAGTTADTARLSFTKPAGTGVADEGWVEIECIVRSVSATGVVAGEFTMIHNLAATGHAVIPCVVQNIISGTFDTTAPTFAGICITSGALDAITIQQVSAEALNMG